jgi:hypothetical protein
LWGWQGQYRLQSAKGGVDNRDGMGSMVGRDGLGSVVSRGSGCDESNAGSEDSNSREGAGRSGDGHRDLVEGGGDGICMPAWSQWQLGQIDGNNDGSASQLTEEKLWRHMEAAKNSDFLVPYGVHDGDASLKAAGHAGLVQGYKIHSCCCWGWLWKQQIHALMQFIMQFILQYTLNNTFDLQFNSTINQKS